MSYWTFTLQISLRTKQNILQDFQWQRCFQNFILRALVTLAYTGALYNFPAKEALT